MSEPSDAGACIPIKNAMISLARDETGKVIGVTVHSLVLTEHVNELPTSFRKAAEGMLYEHAVNSAPPPVGGMKD